MPVNPVRGWLRAIAGGWAVAGIFVARTGEPFSLRLGPDVNDDGNAFSDRPALLAGSVGDLYANGQGDRPQYLIPKADADQRLGVPVPVTDPYAMMGRNAVRSPALKQYDVSIRKRVGLGARRELSLEMNAFNLFNWVNFGQPIEILSDTRFGRVTRTNAASNPRQIQLGRKCASREGEREPEGKNLAVSTRAAAKARKSPPGCPSDLAPAAADDRRTRRCGLSAFPAALSLSEGGCSAQPHPHPRVRRTPVRLGDCPRSGFVTDDPTAMLFTGQQHASKFPADRH